MCLRGIRLFPQVHGTREDVLARVLHEVRPAIEPARKGRGGFQGMEKAGGIVFSLGIALLLVIFAAIEVWLEVRRWK